MAKRKIRRNKGKQTRKVKEKDLDRKSWKIGDKCMYCDSCEPNITYNENAETYTVRCANCNGYQKIVNWDAVIEYENGLSLP